MSNTRSSKYVKTTYNPLHLAYLAGIVDGEGCIHIGYYFNKTQKRSVYHSLLQITSTDRCLIEWLLSNFGGLSSIYTEAQTPKNSTLKPYSWKASGERLTHICEVLLPFAIIKKDQLQIMLEFRKTFQDQHEPKKGQQGIQAMSPELIDYRHSLMSKLRALHCRKGSFKTELNPCALSPSP
jgi:hypothetical protein